MTKSLKIAAGFGAVAGLLTVTHAKESLLTNHAVVQACSDCDVPGMPLFTTFGSSMDNPMIADDGTVMFRTNLAGPTITGANSRALFAGASLDTLSVLAQWSDPAPDLPGIFLVNNGGTQGFGELRLSPDGNTMWMSRLSNSGHNLSTGADTAVFGGLPGSFSLIAREGNTAPGAGGALYGDFSLLSTQYMSVGRNGNIMFYTGLSGDPSSNEAIYGGTVAAPVLAVRKGDTMLPGPITASVFSGQLVMDNNGRILYNLRLAGPGVTPANDESLWVYTPGAGNALLVREGDPAPGTAGGVFGNGANDWRPNLTTNSFTRNGKFSFVCDLLGGDVVPDVNDRAIYLGQIGGPLALFARSGDPAPGTDGVFDAFHTVFTYPSDSGRMVFQGFLRGGTVAPGNDTGIWVGTSGALTLVAREGSIAPGTDGAKFNNLGGWAMAYSDYGLVFQGQSLLGGDVVRNTNARAIFGWKPAIGTYLIGRTGEAMQVTPSMIKTTSGFGFHFFGNTDGSLSLTNGGKFTTNLQFDNGISVVSVDLDCAPATDYYYDADHDLHGDPTTEINLCAGQSPPPGFITVAGDCLDSNAASLGAVPETCNGVDDDCDTLIDEGIPAPTAPLTLKIAKVGANAVVSWPAVAGATAYDVISGDLNELRAAHTYQFLNLASCVNDDLSGLSFTSGSNPSPGNGIWWLMRPLNCDGDGSYSSGAPKERPGRDAEIGTAIPFYACP